jgi:hypothetical protein
MCDAWMLIFLLFFSPRAPALFSRCKQSLMQLSVPSTTRDRYTRVRAISCSHLLSFSGSRKRTMSARALAYVAVWGLLACLHPAAASAQQTYTGAFQGVVSSIDQFKEALVYVASALVVVGLVASAVGWMMRSHEGLGPVFWGGITMVGAGSLVLLGDNFVSAIQQAGN